MSKIRKNKVWQIQEAKARFSELVNEVEENGYCTITKNGRPVVVMMSKKEFENIKKPNNSLLDFFKQAPCSEIDLDVKRKQDQGRDIDLRGTYQ